MISKVKEKIVKSKGFLTKEGELVNYKELHPLGLGFIDGVGFHGKGYRLNYWMKATDDVKKNPWYYEKGYFAGRISKYLVLAALALYMGRPLLFFI